MIDLICVIATLAMIAMILVVVAKKFYVPTSFLMIGLIALFLTTAFTGVSPMGDATSGNIYIDVFEVITKSVTSALGSQGLVIMVVMGYVSYMSHIKAAELFSVLVARPLRKIKRPDILIVAAFILTVVVKLAIPSNSSEITLLIATVYPILIAVGISKETAAAAFLVSAGIVWGPANTLAMSAFNAAGVTDISIPIYFVTKEALPVAIMTILSSIVFIFVNKYYDKKEGVTVDRADLPELQDVSEFGIPKFYAVFPILPVIIIILLSPIVQTHVTISVIAANFACFVLMMVIEAIRKHDIRKAFDDSKALFDGMGKAFVNVVSNLIGIYVFSSAISAIGGLKILAASFANLGGSNLIIAIVGASAAFILVAMGSSIGGTLPLFSSLYSGFASGNELVNMIRMLIFGGSLGSAINPVSPSIMIVSGSSGVPITTIVRRALIPAVACHIIQLVVCILIP